MIEIREATPEDVKNVQRLWADGDVMKYVGFPEGLSETEESIREMICRTAANRPRSNYYAIYEDGGYCGETSYDIDEDTKSASLDIKLFRFARGRGIATKALSFVVKEAFDNGAETVWVDPDPENVKAIALYERLGFEKKPMPAHVVAMGEDPEKYVYMERKKMIMDKKYLIEKLTHDAHEKGGFTGTWLYAEKGEIISKGAVGVNDLETGAPITEDMVFDLASVTKQFTATAIILLRRRGLLSLDDEITKFFPEVPFPGVTVRHLLTHTGGLPDYEDWITETATAEGTIPGNDIMIRFLCESGEGPEFAPGEKWEYSNTGYCVLAQIIEKVSGMSFEDFLEQNIFIPAGLTATKVYHRRKDHITIPNLAFGMVWEKGRYFLPDDSESQNHVVPLDGVNGDGLVHSNIFDLLRWDRVLREGTILTLEEQAEMYTPTLLPDGKPGMDDELIGPACYGYGWDIVKYPEHGLIVCHSGYWPEYETWYERFIDEDKVIVKCACRDQLDARANNALIPGLHAIAMGNEPEPVRSVEEIAEKDPDKSMWESFCGKYEEPDDDLYVDEVFMRGGELYVRLIEDCGAWEAKLYPLGDNKFGIKRYSPVFEFGDGCLIYGGYTCKKL